MVVLLGVVCVAIGYFLRMGIQQSAFYAMRSGNPLQVLEKMQGLKATSDFASLLFCGGGTAAIVGGGYHSRMSGFGDQLSDAQIISILAYIKSTWPARVVEIHNRINADAGG